MLRVADGHQLPASTNIAGISAPKLTSASGLVSGLGHWRGSIIWRRRRLTATGNPPLPLRTCRLLPALTGKVFPCPLCMRRGEHEARRVSWFTKRIHHANDLRAKFNEMPPRSESSAFFLNARHESGVRTATKIEEGTLEKADHPRTANQNLQYLDSTCLLLSFIERALDPAAVKTLAHPCMQQAMQQSEKQQGDAAPTEIEQNTF